MIIANHTLDIIDNAFSVIDRIERIDYIKIGEQIIDKAIIAAAVIYGVTSYIIAACQLWWLQHSESVIINTVRLITNTADFAHEVYLIGAETRRFFAKTTNYLLDATYYTVTGQNVNHV